MAEPSRPYGIKGITDHPRRPVLAKAKIGRMSALGYPEKLDHVIFVEPETGDEIEAFRKLGDKPTSFLAVLPANDIETFVDCAWKRFGEFGLKCRGDGEQGVERKTGRERGCAGPYNKDNPAAHRCRFARPTKSKVNGLLTEHPPECKPVLSLQLLVPLAGAVGLVQLDTGGASSGVPTLFSQLEQLNRVSEGQLAGVAVKVIIRPFNGQKGICYAWALANPSAHDLSCLTRDFAALSAVRVVDGDVLPPPGELPPLVESIDRDIYGLPAARKAQEKLALAKTVSTTDIVVPPEVAGEVRVAEAALWAQVGRAKLPKAKRDCTLEVVAANRELAAREACWPAYLSWLTGKSEELAAKARHS